MSYAILIEKEMSRETVDRITRQMALNQLNIRGHIHIVSVEEMERLKSQNQTSMGIESLKSDSD